MFSDYELTTQTAIDVLVTALEAHQRCREAGRARSEEGSSDCEATRHRNRGNGKNLPTDHSSGHQVSRRTFYKHAGRCGRIRVDTESACKTLRLQDQRDRSKRLDFGLKADVQAFRWAVFEIVAVTQHYICHAPLNSVCQKTLFLHSTTVYRRE